VGHPLGRLDPDHPGGDPTAPHPQRIAGHADRNGRQEEDRPRPPGNGRRVGHQRPGRKERIERTNPATGFGHLQAGLGQMDHVPLHHRLHADQLEPRHRDPGRHPLHRRRDAVVDDIGERDGEEEKRDRKRHDPQPPPAVEEERDRGEQPQQAHPLREDLRAGDSEDEEAERREDAEEAPETRPRRLCAQLLPVPPEEVDRDQRHQKAVVVVRVAEPVADEFAEGGESNDGHRRDTRTQTQPLQPPRQPRRRSLLSIESDHDDRHLTEAVSFELTIPGATRAHLPRRSVAPPFAARNWPRSFQTFPDRDSPLGRPSPWEGPPRGASGPLGSQIPTGWRAA